MATGYEKVKKDLADIARSLDSIIAQAQTACAQIEAGSADLGALSTKYSEIFAVIDTDYNPPTGTAEELAVDEKDKLWNRGVAVKNALDALIATTEFQAVKGI